MRTGVNLSPRERKVLQDFPSDPRTVDDAFQLDPESTIYAVCPDNQCQATHPPKFLNGSPVPLYPSRCRNRRFGKRCNTILLRPRTIANQTIYTPIKPFVFFNPKEWLGRLLARPGIEAEMDQSWKKAQESSKTGIMHDIFDGEVLRNFKGPDGRHFSIGNGEGRYVFSLSVDFFNPLSNKQAGKKISVGVINLTCLNLPPHLRYKPENIFLAGIIPGPREPSFTSLNHFLRPLVDHFLQFWQPGIRYSRTHGHPQGRLVRCAIVCVVCDLPAARKTSGFVSSAHHHFCSVCDCTRKANGYGDTNPSAWKRRTNRSCRQSAKQFRRAGPSAGENIANQTGIRWSQLLRLPYFDPSRFVVVDPMHNLLLGLIHEHFSGILGLHLPTEKNETPQVLQLSISESWKKTFTENEQKSMKKAVRYLEGPMSKSLQTAEGYDTWFTRFKNQHRKALELLCQQLDAAAISSHPNKKGRVTCADFARGLLQWVCYYIVFTFHLT